MASSKVLLCSANVINAILGFLLVAGSIFFFVQVTDFTSLRNHNHYLLDYRVYWPQVIPWMFFFSGILVLIGAGCGCSGSVKRNRSRLVVYISYQCFVIVVLIAMAAIALVFADSKSNDDFVKDTVWDAYFQSKIDPQVADRFGNIERKLQCCGAESPRDYKNWKMDFPMSCCDVYNHGLLGQWVIDCDFTNKLANERHGCSVVAVQYSRIAIRVFSGVSIFTAVVAAACVALAVQLVRVTDKKVRAMTTRNESEKVLL